MSYQQVSLELVRDGQCTPWGFRMTGGADIGTPLVIQKVNFGSPSEGELQKGDIILRIRDTDASRLSHQGATDIITKTGSTLKLVIARNVSGAAISTSPVSTPLTTSIPSGGNPFLYKPLPTTNFAAQRQRRSSVESFTSTTSSDTEKEAIINQPYRSIPLILPGAKITKDIPVGSYLRFDPLCRSSTSSPSSFDSRDPYMLTKVQHAIIEAAQSSSGTSSPGRTPTPDMMNQNGPPMFLRQYNSPINIYSNQAIVEALAVQTVNPRKSGLNNVEMMENKKFNNIKESPTYQLIHDEEWKKGKGEEHAPLEEHVYNVIPRDGGDYYRPEIHQSDSFKSIMHNFRGISDM